MVRPLDGSKPPRTAALTRAEPTTPAVTTSAPSELETKAPDSNFADAKKRLVSITGRNKVVALPPGPSISLKDLAAKEVGALNTPVAAGVTTKGLAAPLAGFQARAPSSSDGSNPTVAELLRGNVLEAKGAKGAAPKEVAGPTLNDSGKTALKAIKAAKPKELAQAAKDQFFGLSHEQRVLVWKNLPKETKAALTKAMEKDPSMGSVALGMAGAMSDTELAAAKVAMRASKGPPSVASLAVGVEVAARTKKWGAENGPTVDHLRFSLSSGSVTWAEGRGQGRTDLKTGAISLDPDLARSPEALAAALAHEGTHSKHVADGTKSAIYNEETSGNLASTLVWKELGDKNDKNLSANRRDTLNDYVAQYDKHGEDGVQARAATEYAKEAAEHVEKNPKSSEAKKVRELVRELSNDDGAQKALTPEYAKELLNATNIVANNVDNDLVTTLGRAFKNAPPEVKKWVEENGKKLLGDVGMQLLKEGMG